MIFSPQDTVFWYLNGKPSQRLSGTIKKQVLIIGGGMAGLSAAQQFAKKNYSVVLLEQYFCGGGASGKSSGFITPDSEINLTHFKRWYGTENARKVWEFGTGGVRFIQQNIQDYSLKCDYQKQDTLVVASNNTDFKKVLEEYESRRFFNYESTLYTKDEMNSVLIGQDYGGAVRYPDTFGIKSFAYCQEMKRILQEMGVEIFEETPVVAVTSHGAQTTYGQVDAEIIVVCADRFALQLGILKKDVYHAQTFLMISAPLTNQQVKSIFPDEPLMVWDTDLIYTYFRLTGDNRLMVGGGSIFSTYDSKENHNMDFIVKKLTGYIKVRFPQVSLVFEYMWPGLIGISKDIVPIADFVPGSSSVYCVSAAAGLPWAAALGRYSADRIIDNNTEFDSYFSLARTSGFNNTLQSFVGTKITFAVSNFISLYIK